jgi:hypothetical protein
MSFDSKIRSKAIKSVFYSLLGFLIVILCGCAKEAASTTNTNTPAIFKPSRLPAFAFYDQLFEGAYQKIGSRNQKWDADAETALRLWAYEQCDNQSVVCGPEFHTMRAAFNRAVTNGCDDPIMNYVLLRLEINDGQNRILTDSLLFREPHATYPGIIAGFDAHPYPAILQIRVLTRAVEDTKSRRAGEPVEPLNQRGSNWIAQAVALVSKVDFNQVERREACDVISDLIHGFWLVTGKREDGYNRVAAELEKNKTATKAICLYIKGRFYDDWAWEARGYGYVDSITETGAKQFSERLALAEQALEGALSQDPSDVHTYETLMNIAGCQGRMDDLERWFQQGKKIDPNDIALYDIKLNYLQPKWNGTEEDMLKFGRECYKEGHWEYRIPFVLLDAHYIVAGESPEDKKRYFARPEVWKEIEPLFKEYLSRFPLDYGRRSSYAYYAGLAGDWDLAMRLMESTRPDLIPTAFKYGSEEYFRRLEARELSKATHSH